MHKNCRFTHIMQKWRNEKMKKENGNIHKFIFPYLLLVVLAVSVWACGEPETTDSSHRPGMENVQGAETLSIEEIASSCEPKDVPEIPAYSGELYTVINDNIPYFTKSNLPTESFEYYSDLDKLGRCGTACANIGQDIMPTEERGEIGQVKPSGWQTVKYDNVDGKYLYNRCHLIGYQLSAENANEKNLITGTRYLNVAGMLPFENMVADYVKETGNHVLYRVTPAFHGDDLLAYGVSMEAWSVEDDGDGVCFHVFVYNVQPDIVIDYANGDSYFDENASVDRESGEKQEAAQADREYILNTNTRKFHEPDCESAKQTSPKNKQSYSGNRDEIIEMGYEPCKRCHP